MRGMMTPAEMAQYWIAQLLGAVLGAMGGAWASGTAISVAPATTAGTGHVIGLEFLFTFALTLVILNVATSPRTEGNPYYGLAIGFTVMAGAFAVGSISGGAFNPAVGIGPNLVAMLRGTGSLGHAWLYLVGPCLGAVAAVPVYNLQHAGDEST